jgi:RNA polymerase sigma factor (sigma-70 family)
MFENNDPDDATLIERCRAGDAAAWEALVRRYQRQVHTIVRRAGLAQPVAADVFQTVFLRLLQHLQRIDHPQRLQAWIVTTAKRETLLQLRQGARLAAMPAVGAAAEQALADEAAGPEETLEYWQQVASVREALDQLDRRCRELLLLLFGEEDVAYDEVARRLGMPQGSIGPTRARCLGKLKRALE